ncbi:hypothetical protein PCANC_01010 [Puccinia coronata f. sp. avenae]|uniref:Uncharacterized protein n=1 Tax=Puccinia coronata f. sp. avenae TaxID=200324 RepID=A0A2N5VIK0_9BASI|nr:hypothetical protein PCASD_01614 [Puccinia coronata f. sp. avenae]PLW57834.1 hypothetical protein PCANC_01010 [Puccinia coronata f. sp. avenae]
MKNEWCAVLGNRRDVATLQTRPNSRNIIARMKVVWWPLDWNLQCLGRRQRHFPTDTSLGFSTQLSIDEARRVLQIARADIKLNPVALASGGLYELDWAAIALNQQRHLRSSRLIAISAHPRSWIGCFTSLW